jgi:class 3 adenylate cyclase
MITSKHLLEKTGISRATLNNYIGLGLVPKPEVKRISPTPGTAITTLGYFPDWVLNQVQQILSLKLQGMSMYAICQQLNSASKQQKAINKKDGVESQTKKIDFEGNLISQVLEKRNRAIIDKTSTEVNLQESIDVSIDKIPYPAYMVNYDFDLTWLNEAAKQLFFVNTLIPERTKDRSLIPSLLEWAKKLSTSEKEVLFTSHFNVIKHHLTRETLTQNISFLNPSDRQLIERCYDQAIIPKNTLVQDTNFYDCSNVDKRIIAISFREGVLFTYIPERADANQLLEWLSHRDSVIRTLLNQRLPVLTPLAVMVADLQNSVRICSELPPQEYFQLINEIWSTLDPIFRKYYGAYGKHTGDGMVYYFLPQPDHNYLMNAILCAGKIREAMKKISHDWSLKKGWTNQLHMNIGLNEGEEWLGTFRTNTNYELVVLGQTINICSRLSDFARFGKIWATKNLVSKLTPSERELIDYGISRAGLDQDIFVSNSYAQISTLLNKEDPRSVKLMEISNSAVTEIRAVK